MQWLELPLAKQMQYASSSNWATRIEFANYPAILPEVADFMIENEQVPKVLSEICRRIFYKSNTNIWSSTLAKTAKKR